jgi:sulfate/thiosulfate transport system ATP-binding protein
MSVEVKNITKLFSRFPALRDVSLKVNRGELLALLGPSGSGKTTLLRIIGGLEIPDPGSGQILLHEKDVTNLSARERQIGFVFQHYALFKHLNVFENIAFGLRILPRRSRPREDEIRLKAAELLRLVQLEGLEGRYPGQLSGGQRQRVALARALAVEPKVLLLDEPFGALDAKVRKELRRWIRRLHNEIHITSIFVTHDQDEALEVAGRVVVMNHGRIEQIGTPDEVYDHPANPFVFNFLGRSINFRGQIRDGRLWLVNSTVAFSGDAMADGTAVLVYARPQDLQIATAAASNGLSLEATIRDMNLAGPLIYLELERRDEGGVFEVEIPSEIVRSSQLREGGTVHVNFKKFQVFPADAPSRTAPASPIPPA